MSDFCEDFTVIRKERSQQTKKVTCFRSKCERSRVDPLPSLLFNTVLQFSLEEDLKRWQAKQKGIRLINKKEDCLTNLRFADDVPSFSK